MNYNDIFVSRDIAILLHYKLNFNEPCIAINRINRINSFEILKTPVRNSETQCVAVPTYEQVIKYFRDVFNIQLYVVGTARDSHIFYARSGDYSKTDLKYYTTHRKALVIGIKYVIRDIIKSHTEQQINELVNQFLQRIK